MKFRSELELYKHSHTRCPPHKNDVLQCRLENVLKGDEKFIESKKQLLKKREAEIVKEAKAAQEKKVDIAS